MDYDLQARLDAHAQLKPKSQGGRGQAVAITTPGAQTRDPNTGQITTDAPTVQACCGVVLGYQTNEVDGTRVQQDDQKLLLSALHTDLTVVTKPQTTDTATVAGVVYKIEDVQPLSPAGVDIMYTLQIRK